MRLGPWTFGRCASAARRGEPKRLAWVEALRPALMPFAHQLKPQAALDVKPQKAEHDWHELRQPRNKEPIMQTLARHTCDAQARHTGPAVQPGLMPFWHDWRRASWRSLLLAWQSAWLDGLPQRASTACASALPSLRHGRAQRWQPAEAGLLRVSAGRLWLTAWAPRSASQDIVLCAGQALWVGAGQSWLIESLDAELQLRWQTAR